MLSQSSPGINTSEHGGVFNLMNSIDEGSANNSSNKTTSKYPKGNHPQTLNNSNSNDSVNKYDSQEQMYTTNTMSDKKNKGKATKATNYGYTNDKEDYVASMRSPELGSTPASKEHLTSPVDNISAPNTANVASSRESNTNATTTNSRSTSSSSTKSMSVRKRRLLQQLGPVPTDIQPRRVKPIPRSMLTDDIPTRKPRQKQPASKRARKSAFRGSLSDNSDENDSSHKNDDDDKNYDDSNNDDEDDDDGEEIYEVEAIISHQVYRGHVINYMVKWKGYDDTENTKEPALKFHKECRELCLDYWRSQPAHVDIPINAPVDSSNLIQTQDLETTTSSPRETSQSRSQSPTTSSIWDRPLQNNTQTLVSPLPPSSTSVTSQSRSNIPQYGVEDEDYGPDFSDEDEYVPEVPTTHYSARSPPSDDMSPINADHDEPLSTTKQNGKTRIRKDRAPDSYALLAKEKGIRQNMVAANYKGDGFELVYSRHLRSTAKRLDWNCGFAIRNILPAKNDPSQLLAYLVWPSELKTVHLIQELHDKCPKKLCLYYEERIRYS